MRIGNGRYSGCGGLIFVTLVLRSGFAAFHGNWCHDASTAAECTKVGALTSLCVFHYQPVLITLDNVGWIFWSSVQTRSSSL
jgi:hypothetical protein